MVSYDQNDAPMLIVFGQSNAHGHNTHLLQEEKITVPLTNVFGLDRAHNQAYGLKDVTWSGFVTEGMNLGETQDHTCCLAESFARLWQERTDAGEKLPPLYIIQISIGAMGIAEKEVNDWNMWWPERTPVMEKGELGAVDISLYPLAVEILNLAVKNLKAAGKRPRIIGLHWNQWETEVDTGGDSVANAPENYRAIFQGLRAAAAIPCPIWLYQPLSEYYHNPEGVNAITELFEAFVNTGDDFHMMDLRQSALWNPMRPDKGIFQEDLVHYLPEAHRFFAQKQMEELE